MQRQQARNCAVCRHPDTLAIEDRLLRGEPQRSVAKAYGIPREKVCYHVRKHMREAVIKLHRDFDTREILRGERLLDQVKTLLVETVDILHAARTTDQDVTCPACTHGFSIKVSDIKSRVAAAGLLAWAGFAAFVLTGAAAAVVVAAALLGTVLESLLGRSGAPWRVSNGHVLNFVNTLAGAAAVDLELGLARTTTADAAGEPRQRVVLLPEPGQSVLELGQLDLQLAVH